MPFMAIGALGDHLACLGPFIHQISIVYAKWRLGWREHSQWREGQTLDWDVLAQNGTLELLSAKSPLYEILRPRIWEEK